MSSTPMDVEVARIFKIYEELGQPRPGVRAFALRHLEEAVELALEGGASSEDVSNAVAQSLQNESSKNPARSTQSQVQGTVDGLAAELADVFLLASCVAKLGEVTPEMITSAARAKVVRLVEAAQHGKLIIKSDGRFYRAQP